MSTIDDIEKAVAALSGDDLARFRAWFDAFDGERLDARIALDERTGKLDNLVQQALTDYRNGEAREV
jgi:hypothetical protein